MYTPPPPNNVLVSALAIRSPNAGIVRVNLLTKQQSYPVWLLKGQGEGSQRKLEFIKKGKILLLIRLFHCKLFHSECSKCVKIMYVENKEVILTGDFKCNWDPENGRTSWQTN